MPPRGGVLFSGLRVLGGEKALGSTGQGSYAGLESQRYLFGCEKEATQKSSIAAPQTLKKPLKLP